jgi:NAD-dependent SIR2 family protein deacetylase
MSTSPLAATSRQVSLGEGLAAIPERLLQAHASGQVLFVVGAGVSRQAGLPDFCELVLKIYRRIDPAVHEAMTSGPDDEFNLTAAQLAEIELFKKKEYDVVLGMLERRIDSRSHARSSVRQAIAEELRSNSSRPAPIHRALMRLSDRGQSTTVMTTNFDLLLEAAVSKGRRAIQRYSLGDIPRPTYRPEFSGVLHIHGALHPNQSRATDLVITDQDFGEYYLRRRVVSDFVYDAARLFSLVFVGYSVSDPPMRYLLSAVAADASRFADLRDRYVFVPVSKKDPLVSTETNLATWHGRSIIPIRYPAEGADHEALRKSLQRWADLSAINGNGSRLEAEIRRIVRVRPDMATEADRDLFEHLIRRGNSVERQRLAHLASKNRADIGWLDAIHDALAGATPQ